MSRDRAIQKIVVNKQAREIGTYLVTLIEGKLKNGESIEAVAGIAASHIQNLTWNFYEQETGKKRKY